MSTLPNVSSWGVPFSVLPTCVNVSRLSPISRLGPVFPWGQEDPCQDPLSVNIIQVNVTGGDTNDGPAPEITNVRFTVGGTLAGRLRRKCNVVFSYGSLLRIISEE